MTWCKNGSLYWSGAKDMQSAMEPNRFGRSQVGID